MFVTHLKIRDFRGIESLDLEFQPGVNVLIGVNGVGKSSSLECLALLFLKYTEEIYSKLASRENRRPIGYEKNKIVISDDHYQVENERVIADPKNIFPGKSEASIKAEISYLKDKFISSLKIRSDSFVVKTDSLVNALAKKIFTISEIDFPLILFYPVDRAILSASLDVRSNQVYSQLDAFRNALVDTQAGFEMFFGCFRAWEDIENEERRDNPEYRDRKLEAIRRAIPNFLPEFSNLRVRRSPLRMTMMKQGQELVLNQLSDGEKCLLAMVGDLARRLAMANPGLDDPLQGFGVILIDEIELHLHPQWQRGILPKLTKTFPNCQFIVSTHSPQIISDVAPESIYVFQKTEQGITAHHPTSSFGRDSNQILETLMGVPERPQWSEDGLRDLFRLIDDGDLEGARHLKTELEQKIGADEPEFTKADVMIRRKEILGR